jgi:hypothetical protein
VSVRKDDGIHAAQNNILPQRQVALSAVRIAVVWMAASQEDGPLEAAFVNKYSRSCDTTINTRQS